MNLFPCITHFVPQARNIKAKYFVLIKCARYKLASTGNKKGQTEWFALFLTVELILVVPQVMFVVEHVVFNLIAFQ